VYQPIPPASGKSPDGPHTHVLPKLLKAGRTHPATEPVPAGCSPAPISIRRIRRGTLGGSRPFEAAHLDSFQAIMAAFGDPAIAAIKQRVHEAVRAGNPPPRLARDRHRPRQRPHRAAADEGSGSSFAGFGGMACEPRSG
jgi:hypothetical protein